VGVGPTISKRFQGNSKDFQGNSKLFPKISKLFQGFSLVVSFVSNGLQAKSTIFPSAAVLVRSARRWPLGGT
jgi:hypothetical protein